MSKVERIWHCFSVFTIASALAFVSVTAYWAVTPFGPLVEIPNNLLYVTNENKTVKAGEDLILSYDICRHFNGEAHVTRYLIDNQIITLSDFYASFEKGCTTVTVHVTIPINAPADTYTYKSTVTYKPNPIRTVSYDFWSEKFQVIK